MNIIYRLEQLQRYYISKTEIVKAIDGITLTIKKGEFITILGPSGSGKSTLLNILAGFDSPTGGKVYFKNEDISNYNEFQMSYYRRFKVGFIFQFYNLHPSLTAFENIEYPMMIASIPKKESQARALTLIKLVGLIHKGENYPDELSGGEKQRIGIARALANNPEVLIADEPTGDLDSENAMQIVDYLITINQTKKTIILVTHDEDILAANMRRINLIDGKLALM